MCDAAHTNKLSHFVLFLELAHVEADKVAGGGGLGAVGRLGVTLVGNVLSGAAVGGEEKR